VGLANGLCDSCAHQELVPNTRGSVFSLCLRSRTDERYPRYPRVPVAACLGYEPHGKDFGGMSISPMPVRRSG